MSKYVHKIQVRICILIYFELYDIINSCMLILLGLINVMKSLYTVSGCYYLLWFVIIDYTKWFHIISSIVLHKLIFSRMGFGDFFIIILPNTTLNCYNKINWVIWQLKLVLRTPESDAFSTQPHSLHIRNNEPVLWFVLTIMSLSCSACVQ